MLTVTVGNTNMTGRPAAYCPKCGSVGEHVGASDGTRGYECGDETCGHVWRVTVHPQPIEAPTRA
ncbi:hypothetical protein [Halorhabdus amylolytica]|uniref:hypothetical protein n=1 Tax=Halorhabdus amylolytica TaxID=2559573 RepID=UPI0010AA9588|nr:hypothetical protein [Halorhabdus amylolytica]